MGRMGWALLACAWLLGCAQRRAIAVAPPSIEELIEPLDPTWPGHESGGDHWRVMTERGPVHLWRPDGYDADSAGTVIYLHGYYVDVDTAWNQHTLAKQFLHSERNALFIAPETPGGSNEAVRWDSLRGLLRAVVEQTHLQLPGRPLVVIAHSGGFRTVVPWLTSGQIDSVVLLDGLYGAETEFGEWLGEGGNHAHSLILVGVNTAPRIEQFLEPIRDAVVRDLLPPDDELDQDQGRERVLFFHLQDSHMELVTEGRVIPSLLRLTPIDSVLEARRGSGAPAALLGPSAGRAGSAPLGWMPSRRGL